MFKKWLQTVWRAPEDWCQAGSLTFVFVFCTTIENMILNSMQLAVHCQQEGETGSF